MKIISTSERIAREIAANPDEVRRLRLSRLDSEVGNIYWYSLPGRFGRIRGRFYRPLHRLWFRLNRQALYCAWVKGYAAGRRDREHYDPRERQERHRCRQ